MKAEVRNCSVFFALAVLRGRIAAQRSPMHRRRSSGRFATNPAACCPGVTVEAASPAIIEKVRTAITDDQGRYRIEALRPGIYKLTFSLTGFSTVVREAIDVPSEVVVTINADLKVGALEETITVSGETPQVDVQQASRTQVITRDIIDTLPVSRNVMSIGVLSPGVRQGTPDVGGSRMTEQVGLRAHGLARRRRGAARRRDVDSEPRRRVAGVLRRHAAVGNHDHDERHPGRHVRRRHPHEQRAEGRRQHLQRRGVHRLQQRRAGRATTSATICARLPAASTARTPSSTSTCSRDRWAVRSSATRLWFLVAARHQSSDETDHRRAGADHGARRRGHQFVSRHLRARSVASPHVAGRAEAQARQLRPALVEAQGQGLRRRAGSAGVAVPRSASTRITPSATSGGRRR